MTVHIEISILETVLYKRIFKDTCNAEFAVNWEDRAL